MEERKTYQNLPVSENPHFIEDGKKIYLYLINKYPDQTVEHKDNILNSLCFALLTMIKNDVLKEEEKSMLQLIYRILYKNIDESF